MSLVRSFLQEGILIEPSLLEHFKTNLIIPEFVDIIKGLKVSFLSKSSLIENYDQLRVILENIKNSKKTEEEKEAVEQTIKFLLNFKSEKKQNADKKRNENLDEPKYKIIESWVIPSRKLSVEDFVRHFKNRLMILKTILQEHSDLVNLTAIGKLTSQKQQNLSIIGIVMDKKVTKNKNIILELEDFTGKVSVLISAGKEELMRKAQDILPDDVIGLRCTGSSEILFANDIVFPEAFAQKKKIDREEFAAFISDIHVGSSRFLEDEFLKFISWLNLEKGSESQKEIAEKIKYLFITGDTVDGVGVYPGQEDLLKIKDIKEQYAKLAELLGKIRKDITIFIIPGQHDAVRLAEPQPPISEAYAPDIYKLENVIPLSNPSMVEVCGRKILLYHGDSFHDIVDNIEHLRLAKARNTPSEIAKLILCKRHIAPTHSYTVYVPVEDTDPMAIREVPDVFATGELHKTDVGLYNNIRTIAGSCWQGITPYEEKVGNVPDPCKVPILNLKTNAVKIIDFSSDSAAAQNLSSAPSCSSEAKK